MCGSCSSCGCAGCKTAGILSLIVIGLLSIAALVGVYMAHMTAEGMLFGTLEGSLSIVAAIFGVKATSKLCKSVCPCNSKGGKCCDSSDCNCGDSCKC